MIPRRNVWTTIAITIAVIVAAIPLGLLSGWLTGQSGPHETVVAATIPAILSIGGGALALAGTRKGDFVRAVQAVAFIVVFCLCFRMALDVGLERRQGDARLSRLETLDAHLQHLEACSRAEWFVNAARHQLGLEPLASEHFCPKTP